MKAVTDVIKTKILK